MEEVERADHGCIRLEEFPHEALQRFVWEFFKPYATVIGPFNLFHVVCLGLVLYAAAMIRSGGRDVRWHSA